MRRIIVTSLLLTALHSTQMQHQAIPAAEAPMKKTAQGILIDSRAEELPGLKLGPFVRLEDGRILTVDGTAAQVSRDGGKSWTEHAIFPDPQAHEIRPERALLRTRRGTVILAFANQKEISKFGWDPAISDAPGAKLPTYAIRSLDGGKSWCDLQKLHDDWTGAIRDMIETREGSVVFSSMMMLHNPGRHAVVTYTSRDDGRTWRRSNILDLGGVGHHGGATEGTLEQLKDGRLWMLLRTNWGRFWSAYSEDSQYWRLIQPSAIEASSAPGLLKRLQSGRLILVWNRPYPEGQTSYPLTGGDNQWSEVPVSNHRQELSIAFSEDEGKRWTKPIVVARLPGKSLAYPYLFEESPGRLWLTAWFGELRLLLREPDFLR